jgi:uncharacterized membrane protein
MSLLFMLLGAAFGAFVCAGMFEESTGWTAAVFGAIVGLLFGQVRTLRARVGKLEQAAQRDGVSAAATSASPEATAAAAVGEVRLPATTPAATQEAAAAPASIDNGTAPDAIAPATGRPALLPAAATLGSAQTPPATGSVPFVSPRAAVSEPSAGDRAVAAIKRWFTEGNVPVKVGVIVLFLGVAALLKYAADQGWLYVRIEFRLIGVAVAALGALMFAWRKRQSHRNFALSLQGGAIGVLILTIFAAFKLYALLPAALAFALLVVVVAGGAMIAVLQDAIALAVLAIVGGFLAPILISTGHGNHVYLFTYYAILNAAVFAIAWLRPWRVLNLVGFAFTFGIGTLWGALQYRPEFFASTEPFLLLFFAFYLLIPLLYAMGNPAAEGRPPVSLARAAGEGGSARGASGGVRETEGRQASERRDRGSRPGQPLIDGTLVFGTPLVAFALQVALLERARMPLAFSALGAAAIYTLLAALELRRFGLKLLGESHALLALGFATLAVPLALSAQATSCTWALEGAALVWLGLRQQRALPRWIGYALQLFAGAAFAWSFRGSSLDPVLLNGEFLGALLIALAGLISARLLDRAQRRPITTVLFFWGLLWWLFAFGNEIERKEDVTALLAAWWLALFAASGVLAAELYRRLDWRDCRFPAALAFVLAPFFIALMTNEHDGPLEGWPALAWGLWLVAAARSLGALAAGEPALTRMLHLVFLWTVALLLAAEAGALIQRHIGLDSIWVALAAFAPLAALFWLTLLRLPPARWPLGIEAEVHRHVLLASLAWVMGIGAVLGLVNEGDPAPLPYVPLLNPLELAQLGYLVLLLLWLRQGEREGGAMLSTELRARALAIAGVLLLTAITLRGAHFLGGVPWGEALRASPLAQAALSITWTLAGIVAMLLGKRRGSRAVWFGGAALMGVVLVKLLLIDRQFMHDLPAIIGVLVVGVLLVAVGYFAPVPPRNAAPVVPAGENP